MMSCSVYQMETIEPWPLFLLSLFKTNCSFSYSTIQYLGFGLSGSNSATSMFQADATIAWVDGNGMGQAQDYYLSSYVQVYKLCLCKWNSETLE